MLIVYGFLVLVIFLINVILHLMYSRTKHGYKDTCALYMLIFFLSAIAPILVLGAISYCTFCYFMNLFFRT